MKIVLLLASTQAAQAGTSFLATLLFARVLTPDQFGAYAVVLTVWMIFLSLNRAALGEQLLAGQSSQSGYYDFSLAWLSAGVVCTAVGSLLIGGWALAGACTYVALFAASDAMRYQRFALAELSAGYARILWIDVGRASLMGLALLAAIMLPTRQPLALCLALLSTLPWLFISARTQGPPRIARATQFIRSRGVFEATMSAQFLMGTATTQLLPLLALIAFGPAAFGQLKLGQSLVAPVSLVGTAFAPGIIKTMHAVSAPANQVKTMVRFGFLSVAAAFVLVTGVMVALPLVGPHLLPSGQWAQVAPLLLPCTVGAVLVLLGQPGSALIRVRRFASTAFIGQMIGVACTAILTIAAMRSDLAVFAWSLVIGASTTVVATYVLLAVRLARERRSG